MTRPPRAVPRAAPGRLDLGSGVVRTHPRRGHRRRCPARHRPPLEPGRRAPVRLQPAADRGPLARAADARAARLAARTGAVGHGRAARTGRPARTPSVGGSDPDRSDLQPALRAHWRRAVHPGRDPRYQRAQPGRTTTPQPGARTGPSGACRSDPAHRRTRARRTPPQRERAARERGAAAASAGHAALSG